ncbi:hypothetical protein QVD17_06356 [Tagetes erecta]|uniref:Uncharacterized protein n=1 Tax=Tagetes erecta TaxID=13708 RepID=A0AAD8LJ80_TARER|nr:hypothetical protein QVD17_06356 [Tagetes erecta]
MPPPTFTLLNKCPFTIPKLHISVSGGSIDLDFVLIRIKLDLLLNEAFAEQRTTSSRAPSVAQVSEAEFIEGDDGAWVELDFGDADLDSRGDDDEEDDDGGCGGSH